MKCVWLFVLAFMWLGGESTEMYNLRYPQMKCKIYSTKEGKTAFEFTWDPVKNWDEKDPIIGYKVVIWELKLKKIKVEYFENEELKSKEREDIVLSPRIVVGDPTIVTVSVDERKAVYDKVKRGVWYEHSALAFTEKGEGPLAPEVAVQVHE